MDYDIELDKIEEKPFKEIVKVAKSLGVKANGKKESIIKRIQSKIKQKNKINVPMPEYQKEAIEKIQQKQLQQQIEIIDDRPIPSTTGNEDEELKEILNNKLNSRYEKLFWSVFKNKYLKMIIWSTIKKDEPLFGSYRHNQIFNVEWILKNGLSQLLRDKVFNGEYLTFNCNISKTEKSKFEYTSGINFGYYKDFKNEYHEYSIFNSFKTDYSFHSKLLINYPLHFKPTSIEMMEELERIAIKYDNLALFQVLENEYQFVSSFGAFEECVSVGSVEIAYHLFTTLKFKIKPKEMVSLWKSVLTFLNDSDDCKLFNKRVDLFINRLCFDKPIQPITNFNLFGFLLHKESLGTLIECCLSVAYLKPQLQGFIDSFPTDENKKLSKLLGDPITLDMRSEKFTILSIDELMVIKKKYLGLGQLDWKPHVFNSNDRDISSIFNMLIMFTSSVGKCIIENYKFYKSKYHGKIYEYHRNFQSNNFIPIKFGVFMECIDINTSIQFEPDLFVLCPNDKEIQLSFIEKYVQYHISRSPPLSPIALGIHFKNNGQNELLVHFLQVCEKSSIKFSVLDFIRYGYKPISSTETLDILLKTCPLKPEDHLNLSIGAQLESIFKLSICGDKSNSRYFKTHFKNEYFNWVNNNQNDFIRFISLRGFGLLIEDWPDYIENLCPQILIEILIEIWNSVNNWTISEFKQAIEMFIKYYPDLDIVPLKITHHKGSKLACQEIYYILNHENQKLVNLLMDGKIENVDSKDLIIVSYLKSCFDSVGNQRNSLDFINGISGNLELLISKYSLKSVVSSLTPYVILNSDIQLLDYLISRIKSLSNKSDSDKQLIISGLVINILVNEKSYYLSKKTIVCQNYTIIKYLLDNFKPIFEKEVALNFFKIALNSGNIDVVKLLIDELGVDLLSDVSEFTPKTYNYFIPIYLQTRYPSKFKSIVKLLLNK